MEQQQNDQQRLIRLREKIEDATNRKPKTPRDFDILSEQIFEKTHERLSATTLKRVWGYLVATSTPRVSTLDILAQFIDYRDWDDFCRQEMSNNENSPQEPQQTTTEPKTWKRNLFRNKWVLASFLIFLLIGTYAYSHLNAAYKQSKSGHIIKVGDRFSTPHEYLALFDIYAKDSLWGQVLPGHPNISIWGPQYHHPEWHNEGDSARYMPTITEYWHPEGEDINLVTQRNFDQYKHYSRLNELRITFMKDLVDTNYVYLGVYRLSLHRSDTTKCVWERVAHNLDLDHLDFIEELNN